MAGAQATINFYQADLNAARATADATLSGAQGGLQQTISIQDGLVAKASSVLNTVSTVGQELQNSNIAKKAIDDFQIAEAGVLSTLSAAVTGLANCAEKAAFDTANAGLSIARANSKDLDVARSALRFAEEGTDAVIDVGGWVIKHTVNILNIQTVEVTGDLRGLCKEGTELKAHVVGTFADNQVDFSVEFLPAKGEELCKRVFERVMGDVKAGVVRVKKEL